MMVRQKSLILERVFHDDQKPPLVQLVTENPYDEIVSRELWDATNPNDEAGGYWVLYRDFSEGWSAA